MDANFNHEQSLALINEMIQRAQNNVRKGKTYSMIFWGYVIAAAAVTNSVLIYTLSNPNQSFLIWLVTVPAFVVSYFIERSDTRAVLVKTHIDKIGSMVWTGYAIGSFVLLAVIFTIAYRFEAPAIFLLITPVILIMVGTGQFVTACVYRSKKWYWVAALFWAGAIVSAFLLVRTQYIVLAACMLFGFIIPGYLLNHQAKKSHV